jgi:hypothetical protein
MISLEDVVGFCDLTADEVRAIAEHEHMADGLAAVLGASLLQAEHGPEQIRDMIVDDMRAAVRRRDIPYARHLVCTLRQFLREHPGAEFRRAA